MYDENYYRGLIQSIRDNITRENQRINKAQGKIDRLNNVYSKVKTQKSNAKELKKTCGKLANDLTWKGTAFDSYKESANEMKTKADSYKNEIDTLMDAILNEISRLENSKYSSWNVIGRLNGSLQNAENELRKLFN